MENMKPLDEEQKEIVKNAGHDIKYCLLESEDAFYIKIFDYKSRHHVSILKSIWR